MKVLLMGNSGSGKSTYAHRLAVNHGLIHLDLDTIVWAPGKTAILQDPKKIMWDIDQFVTLHPRWVIEGCYGDLVQHLCHGCTELIFMNPGQEVCVANTLRRPWEPQKYVSNSAQQRMLPTLIEWVKNYYTRMDAWSYAYHSRIYREFAGLKRMVTLPEDLSTDPILEDRANALKFKWT